MKKIPRSYEEKDIYTIWEHYEDKRNALRYFRDNILASFQNNTSPLSNKFQTHPLN